MIVSYIDSINVISHGENRIGWHSLARRGMLHGECESFDFIRLDPGSKFEIHNRGEIERAWFILSGSGRMVENGSDSLAQKLRSDDVVLMPARSGMVVQSGTHGLDLLCLEILTEEVSRVLPRRRPIV